jgi:glycerate kinase
LKGLNQRPALDPLAKHPRVASIETDQLKNILADVELTVVSTVKRPACARGVVGLSQWQT